MRILRLPSELTGAPCIHRTLTLLTSSALEVNRDFKLHGNGFVLKQVAQGILMSSVKVASSRNALQNSKNVAP